MTNQLTPTNPIDEWPFPDLDHRFDTGDYSWREVSERIFDDMLGCVPPAIMKGCCFAVGEPWKHTDAGVVHTMFCWYQERYFGRNELLHLFNPERFINEIIRQLKT